MRKNLLRVIHRVTGLSLALPLLLLVVTGVPLQFTDWLGLGKAGVPFTWVHASYNINAPEQVLRANEVVQLGDTLLTAHRDLQAPGELLGAQHLEQMTLVATTQQLLLIPTDPGAPVERNRFPRTVRAFGMAPTLELGIDTLDGRFRSEDFGASWRAGDLPELRWFEPDSAATTALQARRYGAAHLSWERWLQDLHSGRFFGEVGVWIMSLAAFAVFALSVTGFLVWFGLRAGRRGS